MDFLEQHPAMIGNRDARGSSQTLAWAQRMCGVLLVAMLVGCSSGPANIPAATESGPQLYMAPVIAGGSSTSGTANLATYAIDDTAQTFVQNTYAFSDTQTGAQVNYSGVFATPALQRGLIGLGMTYVYGPSAGGGGYSTTTYSPPQLGGWTVELPGQGGALANLLGQPFVPLVPAVTCPAMSAPESFWFLTLPAPLITTGTGLGEGNWNPLLETAYGSVDISASGNTVTLNNIQQHTLPSTGGSGVPASPAAASITGACSPTVYGNAVSVPGQLIISSPGSSGTATPQALIGIGPSGLLVENNNGENSLGAGTGAIGLPKPSSPVDASSLAAAQYLGSFYGSGTGSTTSSLNNWFSTVASFGFPATLQSSCSALAAQTDTLVNGIYGGDFPVDTTPNTSTTGVPNPSLPSVQANGGYGNCDFAIALGAQDPSNNGLFPAATVFVGSAFAANTTGKTYSFPAVAIAGQLQGKYVIFLIGQDSVGSPNQAWGIYLLQSN